MIFRALAFAGAAFAAATVALAGARGAAAAPAEPTAGPLRVHPDNPRWFSDARGRAVLLAGSHMGWELQDDAWGREHRFDWEGFLDRVAGHGQNYIRLWVVEHTRWDVSRADALAHPMPWARTGPGLALDGKPRFDLERLDPAFFERLQHRVREAGRRGVWVSVMLFQGHSLHIRRGRNPWFGHPLNARNNIQGLDADTDGDGDGRETHTLENPAVTAVQDRYVRRMVDALSGCDNALWEIANEAGLYSTRWQVHWIRRLRELEKDRPLQHPIGMTVQVPTRGGQNDVLYSSPADWISPGPEGGWGRRPPVADGRKVVLSDTDHHGPKPFPERRRWVWRTFFRGASPVFLDMYPAQETRQRDRITDARPDPRWEPIREALGRARRLADRLPLGDLTPRPGLATSGYCLAAAGREYVVYLPEGGPVTVDLRAAKGTFSATWLDARSGAERAGDPVPGGDRRTLRSPFEGDAVLRLRALR